MARTTRKLIRSFRERQHEYQIRHALAGRARRCPCCLDHQPASGFEGQNLVCRVCEDDIAETMEREIDARDGLIHGEAPRPARADDGWCPRGCQHLCGLGECGNCGYVGDGVPEHRTAFVIDACEESGGYRLGH